MFKGIKGIYFDFGYVIGYPKPDIEKKFLYLDWEGINNIFVNKEISQYLKTGVGLTEIEAFFNDEIYSVFVNHEKSDLVDPQSYNLLQQKLHVLFNCKIDEVFINRVLFFINTMKYIEIYPNVSYLLRELKNKGYLLSMISNMMLPGRLLIEKLRENNIFHYFNTVTISSDVGYIKPHKEMFLRTLNSDSLNPEEIMFVGDSYYQDIVGAKSVGMKTVWLNFRKEVVNEKDCANYEILCLHELLNLV
ncbi:MAG: HAD family hydrolase [Clostridium sp.]|uniref:HAD family hydrolase n=1 Tax=Clostridium sp. TaxID=1506 RepID=UPI0039E8B0E3